MLLGGLIFSKLLARIKFPQVTGYLIAGLVIGPSVLNLIPADSLHSLDIINDVALSFIAFSIGNEMKIKNLKKIGPAILIITLCEALGAFFLVSIGTYFIFHESLAFSLALGSIACATAPAATLMVIRQYKAKGELVDVLIPVVALDDAVCIVSFGIASTIAISLISGHALNVSGMILIPLLEIGLAIVIGVVIGFCAIFFMKRIRNDSEMMTFILAVIFLGTALALHFDVSALLTLMVCGFLIGNYTTNPMRYITLIDYVTPPIFVSFFVISGADLNLSSLRAVGFVGIYYILARVVGKWLGAYISTRSTGFSKNVQKYLGITLIPQAGVAIGLSLIASKIIPGSHGKMIRTTILGATFFYELMGPLLAKIALKKSGCIASEK